MTIERILGRRNPKTIEFKKNLPGKEAYKYYEVCGCLQMEPEEKLFLELRTKPEKWLALTRKMYSKRWMRLPMPSRIAVNRQLFQILRCRQLMARRLLWQKFLKADSGHITLKRLDEREAYMSVLLEQPRLADEYMIKELMLEGSNRYFDQALCTGLSVTEEEIDTLCKAMKEQAVKNAHNEEQKASVKDVGKQQLRSWGYFD